LNGLKNSWVFPAIQSIHIVGIALLVGTIVIVDLHRLGYGPRHRANEFNRWTRIGAAIMFVTGPILFAADVTRYLSNAAFRLKMVFLLLAVVFHFAGRDRVPPKLAALISMALWTCVVLGGRAIADFDI
jgi:hypothetical protein